MEIRITSDKDPFLILLLSDTHVFRSGAGLPPAFLERFRGDGPDMILHCGDVSVPSLLEELGKIAPVYAVRGNRDLLLWNRLPPFIDFDLKGFRIHAEHGQGGLLQYLRSKTCFMVRQLMRRPFDPDRVVSLRDDFSGIGIYCFGHSHVRKVCLRKGTVFVNPGHINTTGTFEPENPPSYALLGIASGHIFVRISVYSDGSFSETEYNYSRNDGSSVREMPGK